VSKSKLSRRRPNLRLVELRHEAGLSQRRLAMLAGVSPGVVQLAEKGWTPRPQNAHRVLEVLEIRLDRKVPYVAIWPVGGPRERV
jgi:transcriptional regulator with XRE-family HTH domain